MQRAIKANQCAFQINWNASHDVLACTSVCQDPSFLFFTFGNLPCSSCKFDLNKLHISFC